MEEVVVYIEKLSILSCTVGVPLRTAIGEANDEERMVRMETTSDSGPDTENSMSALRECGV